MVTIARAELGIGGLSAISLQEEETIRCRRSETAPTGKAGLPGRKSVGRHPKLVVEMSRKKPCKLEGAGAVWNRNAQIKYEK